MKSFRNCRTKNASAPLHNFESALLNTSENELSRTIFKRLNYFNRVCCSICFNRREILTEFILNLCSYISLMIYWVNIFETSVSSNSSFEEQNWQKNEIFMTVLINIYINLGKIKIWVDHWHSWNRSFFEKKTLELFL